MVGFWFLEVTSLLYIVMTLNFFISGHMLPARPLARSPGRASSRPCRSSTWPTSRPSSSWARCRGWTLVLHLLLELTWAVVFMAPVPRPLPAGLKRYSAYRRVSRVLVATFGKYLRTARPACGRYTLNRELAFRGNFLVKVSVEVLWLGILLAFYRTVFAQHQPRRRLVRARVLLLRGLLLRARTA